MPERRQNSCKATQPDLGEQLSPALKSLLELRHTVSFCTGSRNHPTVVPFWGSDSHLEPGFLVCARLTLGMQKRESDLTVVPEPPSESCRGSDLTVVPEPPSESCWGQHAGTACSHPPCDQIRSYRSKFLSMAQGFSLVPAFSLSITYHTPCWRTLPP